MSKSFRYVKDFEFPSQAGYTGSCGTSTTKGYAKGGTVRKADGGTVTPTKAPAPQMRSTIPTPPRRMSEPTKAETPKIAATKTPANAHGKATSAAAHARNEARRAAKAEPTPSKSTTATRPAATAPTATRPTTAIPTPPRASSPLTGLKNAASRAPDAAAKGMKTAKAAQYKKGGKVMRKADGGDVTVNEDGQRLFVSRPATTPEPTPVAAAAPAPVKLAPPPRRRRRREVMDEYRRKKKELKSTDRHSENYDQQRQALRAEMEAEMKNAVSNKGALPKKMGGPVRKSYPTNKSEPMIKAKSVGAYSAKKK